MAHIGLCDLAGRQLREEALKERGKLEAIRSRMVDELRTQGINPRYLSEMEKLDIGKLQQR